MFRRRHRLAAAVVAAAILTASCSGGARPTVTSDQLVEPSETIDTATFEPASEVPNMATPAPDDDAPDDAAGDASEPRQLAPGEVERLLVQVLETFPHDATAFTQGLELDNGVFLESTGSRGLDGIQVPSTLRRVDPATGNVEQSIALDQQYFGEGLTKVGNELIQLTWKQNTAFYWDAETFELNKQVSYDGQGWGLCYDGSHLVMTDGTVPELIFRDPVTFEETARVPVTFNDQQVFNLNELECVDGFVWANIWQTDLIVRIDPSTGAVNGVADAIELGGSVGMGDAVLNGIAWDSSTQSFYVTGKLWPTMFRVNFVPAPTS